MKRIGLLVLFLSPLALFAQVDDMFYVPKKEIKAANVANVLSADADEWGAVDYGNTRDVDEYNRRSGYNASTNTISADAVENIIVNNYNEESADYDYSTRIVRFHNPASVVVTSYDYYDPYPSVYYYDDWYWGSRLGWSCYWDGFGLGFSTGWHTPYHYPHHHHWHSAPHHHTHHGVAHAPRSVGGRIPSADLRGGGNGRRPVAQADRDNGGRVPVAQIDGNKRKDNNKINSSGEKRKPQNVGEKRNNVKKDGRGSNVRRASGSTYNRPSSSGVRRNSSSGGTTRRSSVSRGGTPRGSRR